LDDHDGRNDFAEAGKREKICREGRYGNDHDEMSINLGQRCQKGYSIVFYMNSLGPEKKTPANTGLNLKGWCLILCSDIL